MIEPMMATMLGFVTTDAAVPPAAARSRAARSRRRHVQRDHGRRRVLDQRLRHAARQRRERRHRRRAAATQAFADALRSVCLRLALGIVRGGEGATKLVTVTVTGAASAAEARKAAKAIANSPLVKTAIHGGDPNWGRLIAVAGRAGVGIRAESRAGDDRTDRAVQGRPAVRRGGAGSRELSEEERRHLGQRSTSASAARRPRSGRAI